ncbi:hypothetical protein STENM223S_08882 [Streptomyces tendae]
MKDRAGRRRARRFAIGTAVVVALAGMNGPWLYRFGTGKYHQYKINEPEYKAANGKWEIVDFPEEYRQNTIHAALLRTGKVLMVAGSGNNQDNSDDKQYDTRIGGPRRRGLAEGPARRVAPALVRGALGVGAVAVAAGVDDEVLAAHLGGELLAVGEGFLGAVEVRDVDREAVGPVDAGPLQGVEDLVGVAPAGVARVQVHPGVLQGGELLDRALEEVVALLVELLRGAAVHEVEHRVRFQDHDGGPVADALGHVVDEGAVGVAVGGAAARVLAAVAVRDVVEDEQCGAAGLVGGLGEAAGLLLGVLRADPLAGRLLGDPADLIGPVLLARLGQGGHLPGRGAVGVDPERVGLLGLLRDPGARPLALVAVTGRGAAREQQGRRSQHRRRSGPPPGRASGRLAAVHPTPLGALLRGSILTYAACTHSVPRYLSGGRASRSRSGRRRRRRWPCSCRWCGRRCRRR